HGEQGDPIEHHFQTLEHGCVYDCVATPATVQSFGRGKAGFVDRHSSVRFHSRSDLKHILAQKIFQPTAGLHASSSPVQPQKIIFFPLVFSPARDAFISEGSKQTRKLRSIAWRQYRCRRGSQASPENTYRPIASSNPINKGERYDAQL